MLSLFSNYSQGDELREAARNGDVQTIKKILSSSTGLVFSADHDGYIPLICASMEGHTEAATLLLNVGGNVHHETKYGYTALSHACANGHTNTAVMLIDRGATVDHEDHDQSTPLILACAGGHTKTAIMLLEKGANIHHEAKHGRSPITYACNWGRTATALMLVTRGANVNHETKDGAIPLTRACANGHIETSIILIEMGADMTHKDKTSRVPLDYITDQVKREGMEKAIQAYKVAKDTQHKQLTATEREKYDMIEATKQVMEREKLQDRFRFLLSGILAGGRCANLQMSLLKETAKALTDDELDVIFTAQTCSWDRLTWMNKKTNMESEELDNLKRYMSCRQF